MSATDTPRSSYRVLEARATLLTGGVLVGLAALAWWSLVTRFQDMTTDTSMPGMPMDMVSGLGSVGTAMMPFDMDAWLFLAMWITMMVAMMFPTIAPIVLLHRMVMRRRGVGVLPTGVFVAGYLVVWSVIGLLPLALLWLFRDLADGTGWVAPTAGVVLLVAGAYQFTRWKELCQRACRSPLTFLATHDFGTGLRGTFRAGASHGLYCLGCCWALMAVLFVVGLMNLAWMAAIAVVFLLEKNWRHGLALSRVVGVGVALLGVAVLVRPEVLTAIA